jgi:aspartate kinase
MKVFKFGGASLKDTEAIKNAIIILQRFKHEKIVLIVSAMGKMTNAFELLHKAWFTRENTEEHFFKITQFHNDIVHNLFPENHFVHKEVEELYIQLKNQLEQKPNTINFDKTYDIVVPYGEKLSSLILHHYCLYNNLTSQLADATKMIITDNTYREARINWELTEKAIMNFFKDSIVNKDTNLYISQGFIGMSLDNNPTTLGREGSDFSAAIFAYCLNAKEVTIWKDVRGLFNADPKYFEDVTLLPHVSYHEAVELAYYGQSIIHPKTIKPLQNKQIPLFIRSFIEPNMSGSVIDHHITDDTLVPSYILKDNQMLISVSTKDFSFVNEYFLEVIFSTLAKLKMKTNVMQNSALSFSFCTDFNQDKLNEFLNKLQNSFIIKYNTNLKLITIRNYNDAIFEKLIGSKHIILEQRSRTTAQIVVGN